MSKIEVNARLFEKNLRGIVDGIVWKNQQLATKCEPSDHADIVAADKYTSAARKLLMHFTVTELCNIEDYDEVEFNRYLNTVDKQYINLLETFHNYEEKNNYYRMLYGLPNYECVNDVEPIQKEIEYLKTLLTPQLDIANYNRILKEISRKELEVQNLQKFLIFLKEDNQWNIPTDVPVHKLYPSLNMILEHAGVFDDYKELSKTEDGLKYVNHLTYKRIHPFVARLAGRFELLYIPETTILTLKTDFHMVYDECREYMIQRYYSEAFRNQDDQYEGFVGLAIMFMTIQRMHVKYLEADVTRDFYDLDSIKLVYDAYSVPFYEDIPVTYHQKIVKMLNRLLAYKGSNQVFFDLCALFDYNSLTIFQYYLLKKRKMDENGNPVFYVNEDGTPNNESMFDVSFIQGKIGGDPFFEVTNQNNELNYYGVTTADKFWINDGDLLNKLYSMEYNFIETKYIGLQMIFSLTKFTFESGYFIRIIMDNRNQMRNIRVSHGKLGVEIDLFTLIIYVHAILCLLMGYEGNIPTNINSVGKIIGFDFKEGLSKLRVILHERPNLVGEKAAEINKIVDRIKLTTMSSIGESYHAIIDLEECLQRVMWETHDKDVYFTFKELYQALLTTRYTYDIFLKSDGTLAKSYLDLLGDINMPLAIRIQYMSENELTSELQYSLIALQKVCDDLKYIQNFGMSSGEVIANYLYKLIRLFKSAKAELIDFNIMYVMDNRVTNLLKWLAYFKPLTMDVTLPGDEIDFFDYIKEVLMQISVKSELTLKDYNLLSRMVRFIHDYLYFYDEIKLASFRFPDMGDVFEMFDYFTGLISEIEVKSSLRIQESFNEYTPKYSTAKSVYLPSEGLSYGEKLNTGFGSINVNTNLNLSVGVQANFGLQSFGRNNAMPFQDKLIKTDS